MNDAPHPVRRARGEIEALPSGSMRVRVYAGVDPTSGRRSYLTETVPAGPTARADADLVLARLLGERDARRRRRGAARAPVVQDRAAAVVEQGATVERGATVEQGDDGSAVRDGRGRRRGEMTVARIARLAEVSAPTVSKVLNGRSGVAAETRRRVEALLHEHGYRRPDTVVPAAGVEVVFYGMQSSLAIEIMHGVEQIVGDRKLAVGFTDVTRQVAAGRTWAEDLLGRRPTGVILVHLGVTPQEHALLAASGIPVVALDPTGRPSHGMPSVGATNWSGGVMSADHLVGLGHRQIAVITGPTDRLCARARLEGARAALDAAGAPLQERLLRVGLFSFDDGLEHGLDLLRAPDPPTAVLCGNDLQALGVYEAARRLGLRIPEDLSVVGFDDIPPVRWCGPAMTTVRQPLAEMGAAAATMVLALAGGQEPTETRVELATGLVVRESTAPPRGRGGRGRSKEAVGRL